MTTETLRRAEGRHSSPAASQKVVRCGGGRQLWPSSLVARTRNISGQRAAAAAARNKAGESVADAQVVALLRLARNLAAAAADDI